MTAAHHTDQYYTSQVREAKRHPQGSSAMRFRLLLIILPFLAGCETTAQISGSISAEGSCSAVIDGTELQGPEGGVRLVSRATDPSDPESRFILVVYCRLHGPEEEPARIDFVKLHAPETGVLEPGVYQIDTAGNQPRSIGVVITAPSHLDGARDWQPTSGTLQIDSATATSVDGSFEMEVRARGARSY